MLNKNGYFAKLMFSDCSLLKYGNGLHWTFLVFPKNPYNAFEFAFDCFAGCTQLLDSVVNKKTLESGSSNSIARS